MVVKKKIVNTSSSEGAPKTEAPKTNEQKTGVWTEVSKHLMTGISYMIPVLIMGGLVGAFSQIIPYVIFGLSPDVSILDAINSGNYTGFNFTLLKIAQLMQSFGFTLFGFAIPLFAAFTAFSIGGKTAFATGFIGGYIAVKPIATLVLQDGKWKEVAPVPSGFLGAIIIAFAIGYFVKFLNEKIQLPKNWLAFKTTFLIPLIAAIVTMILMVYIITPFGGLVNGWIKSVLEAAGKSGQFVYALILSATTAFDLGGPVNKAAGFVALGLSTLLDRVLVRRRVYDKQFYEAGKTSIFLAFMGISEGAIPFALERPMFTIPLYVVGSIIGAMTGVGLGAVQWFPESAIWAWPLITNIFPYVLGIAVGSIFIAVVNIYYRNHLIKIGKLEVL